MKEGPETLDAALELARKLHTVEIAQRKLGTTLKSQASTSQTFTVQQEAGGGTDDDSGVIASVGNQTTMIELSRQVQKLSEEIKQLRVASREHSNPMSDRRSNPRRIPERRRITCWWCGELGHIQRNCPSKNNPLYRSPTKDSINTVHSSVSVRGWIDNVPMSLLVDTGSALTLIKEGICRAPLQHSDRVLVAANGSNLEVLGKASCNIRIQENSFPTPVLVVKGLSQPCILGADFLCNNHCRIDLARNILDIQGKTIPLDMQVDSTNISVCRVAVQSTTTIPGQHKKFISVCPCSAVNHNDIYLFEPFCSFLERHEILVARSVSNYRDNDTLMVEVINPLKTSVTIYKGENIGKLSCVSSSEIVNYVETRKSERKLGSLQNSPQAHEAVGKLIKNAGPLPTFAQQRLTQILWDHINTISISEGDLGRTSLLKHSIQTNGSPICQPPHRLPFHKRTEVQNLLSDMEKKGIVEPSHSPWSSPIVLVKKKDGSTRFCLDFRQLNSVTCKDAQPIPRIDDTLDSLSGSCWFSTLDLASGYWQVEMKESDKEKTAFRTPFGLFHFKVMPFGLCNAPATFQRLMELILKGLNWTSCLVYLDDIIIFSKSIDEHLQRLKEVLSRLELANLKIKPEKCKLFQTSVKYLGHIVSDQGIHTDPEKVSTIRNWPQPANTKELRQFLGLVSYYQKFIHGFANQATPLYKLIEKNRCWTWTVECEEAFQSLKQSLCESPVLAYPDFMCPFRLDVDASMCGLGAILSQKTKEGERVIALQVAHC